MSTYDLDSELGAIQFMLSVLIASHPDKANLLATFDRLSSENQVAAIALGGSGIAESLRASISKYRAQIQLYS